MSTDVAADLSLRLASEIKTAMVRRGVSGAKLAKELGVSAAWVSYRLTGTQEIGVNDLQRIAAVLHVSVLDLIGHAERGDGSYVTVGSHGTAMGIFTPEVPRPRGPVVAGDYPQPDLAAASFVGTRSLPGRAGRNGIYPSGPRETAPTGL